MGQLTGQREGTFDMPKTVADFDRELEEAKKRIVKLNEGRKAAAAKEREQSRRLRAAKVSVMGEMLLESLGCGWNEVDLTALQPRLEEWADGHREDIRLRIVSDALSNADAKQALDAFKKSRREAKAQKSRPAPTAEPDAEGEGGATAESDGDNIATW